MVGSVAQHRVNVLPGLHVATQKDEAARQGEAHGFGFRARGQRLFQAGQNLVHPAEAIGLVHKPVERHHVVAASAQGQHEVVERHQVIALLHGDEGDTAQGLVGTFQFGGLPVQHQGLVQFAALHGHRGQAEVGFGALRVGIGGPKIVFPGLVPFAHVQAALAQFPVAVENCRGIHGVLFMCACGCRLVMAQNAPAAMNLCRKCAI